MKPHWSKRKRAPLDGRSIVIGPFLKMEIMSYQWLGKVVLLRFGVSHVRLTDRLKQLGSIAPDSRLSVLGLTW